MHAVCNKFISACANNYTLRNDYFKVLRTIHNTKESGQNLMLPKVRTETARKAFYFNGSKVFNNIPSQMKEYN